MRMSKIKSISKNKIRAIYMAAFIIMIGKSSFSYDYNPITFNLSAEYIRPLVMNLNDKTIDLGEFVVGTDLTKQLSFSTGMTLEGNPGEMVVVTVPSFISISNSNGDSIYIKTIIENGGSIILDQNGIYNNPLLQLVMTSTEIIQAEGDYTGLVTVTAQTK